MKLVSKVEFNEEEKKAIMNAIETVSCDGVECEYCPFCYNHGCMWETLREVVED